MHRSLLFTFITADRPGIIDRLSGLVAAHHGNWLASRLTRLSGRFAGVVQLHIAEDNIAGLRAALAGLQDEGIAVLLDEPAGQVDDRSDGVRLSVIGLDRPGIVREIAQALATRQINVTDMRSSIDSAPMTGEPLFRAELAIDIPAGLAIDSLHEELDTIANRLDIDWQLGSN